MRESVCCELTEGAISDCSIDCSQRRIHMNMETNLITRVGQGLLAVAATGATVLVLQLAMVAA
jgi:hypothetical protein